jgi:hypothetical protein
MKWNNDPDRYEKYLLLDCIIKFSNVFRDKDASEISLRQLFNFIDQFILDEKNKHG